MFFFLNPGHIFHPPFIAGGTLLSLSLEYAPLPSLPSLQIAPQLTPLVKRLNALIICLLPNPVFTTPPSWYPSFPHQNQLLLNSVPFEPEKEEKVLSTLNSDSASGLDDIISRVRESCSAAVAHPFSALFILSFVRCHLTSPWKSANITALHKKVQKLIPLTADLSLYFQS